MQNLQQLPTATFTSAQKNQESRKSLSSVTTITDKQRKQIEFIDEIYNKVVLKRETSSKKDLDGYRQCQEQYRRYEMEKENSVIDDAYSPFGRLVDNNEMLDLQYSRTGPNNFKGSPSTVLMVSASDGSRKNAQMQPSLVQELEQLSSRCMPVSTTTPFSAEEPRSIHEEKRVMITTSSTASLKQEDSTSQFYLGQAVQLQETLKALN